MIDWNVVIISLAICLTIVVSVWIITKSIKSVFVSRSHLAVFNRQSKAVHKQQIEEFEVLIQTQSVQIDDLNSKISALTMSVGMMN